MGNGVQVILERADGLENARAGSIGGIEIGTWLFRMRKPARDLKLVQKGLVTKA